MKFYEFFLNYSCNAKCGFCFNPVDPGAEQEKGLEFGVVAERMYAGHAQGYRGLKFIGGEVTLRDDLPKIARLARRIGYESVQVTTNALRLADAGYARSLVTAGVDSFRFSIHGHTSQVHDATVEVPGAFEKILRAQANLRVLGHEIGINTVVSRLNAHCLAETAAYFYDSMKVDDVLLYFVRHQGFMELPANRPRLELTMTEGAAALRAMYERLGKRKRLPVFFHMPPCQLPERADLGLDWEAPGTSDLVIHPHGATQLIEQVTHAGKAQVAACRGCRYEGRCLGVERRYVERFGEAEIRPVR